MSFDKIKSIPSKRIELKEHQKLLGDFIINPKVKGLIVFHSVGSGKGLTSLNMAKRLLLKYPNKKIFVVTPTSLIGNYHKEINKFNFDFKGNINVTSYLTFINKVNQHKMDPKNQILIIDEAHNFNTLYSNRSIEIGKICADAFKVILLTATPVKNYPHEIVNLLLFISKEPFSKKDAEMKIMSLHDKSDAYKEAVYSEYCKCKISFFKNVDKSSYPSTKEHIIRFRMTINYYNKYYAIQKHILKNLPDMYKNSKDLTYFINGVRRAINKIDDVSPKIEWAQEKIKSEYLLNKKSLVYSSFKDSGINIIKKYLIKNGISYSEISGEISKKKRDIEIINFNNGKNMVLLVTAAGSEGLDLKNTRNVIIIEPYWNPSRIDQVIGRAVRYESHVSLPKKDRHVDIYRLLVSKPLVFPYLRSDFEYSADDLLYKLSNDKQKLINDFYKHVEKLSIENNKKCFT